MAHAITIARGDGIGPEIMDATLFILKEAGCALDFEEVRMGEKLYAEGFAAGIHPEVWDSIRRTGILLKAPMTTPQGKGVKSLNVTLRKTLGLFANIRPVMSLAPVVASRFPDLDVIVVRENEEDLYAGIEHRQTDEVVQCLKLMSRPGTERLVRFAFEYAVAHGRKRVTCMTKDNIMKLTDGMFHAVFREVAQDYPQFKTDHMIIDIGTARLATRPEGFDVLVLPNLYGDILSDVVAELSGSVGLAGSCNLGRTAAMYEAIHGSAPDIAGRGIANPSGLLNGAIMMLKDLGMAEAGLIENAWLKTLEDGIHTGDVTLAAETSGPVGTRAFAEAVVARLGQKPTQLRASPEVAHAVPKVPELIHPPQPKKALVGVDVFLAWRGSPDELGPAIKAANHGPLALQMITNRGVKVWPDGFPETFCTDHWRCRYQRPDKAAIAHGEILALLSDLAAAGFDFIKTENLYTFDGEAGFSAGQGQ
jgi:isocitrate dehydrogenase